MTDFNTGAFTSRLDPARTISVGQHRVRAGEKTFFNVELGDLLKSLTARLARARMAENRGRKRSNWRRDEGEEKIDAKALYPRLAGFLRENDILIAETGTASMGLGFARMPSGANFYNQTLWGSIGWATPAAFGAAVAAPRRRVVLLTGDGAHQFTVQEISQFARHGLKPIVFVINNSGYLIERLLCREPEIAYNEIAPWRYSLLPRAFGCDDWFAARVETCGELDRALAAANSAETGVYIEIVTDPYAASALATRMHEEFRKLYR